MASKDTPVSNDLLEARLAFLKRAKEQLIAKRNNLVILRDIEKFFYDEQNFYILMKRNLNAIAKEGPPNFCPTQEDFEKVDKDFALTNIWRRFYAEQRALKIFEINAIEASFPPRPNYRIKKVVSFLDDTLVYPSQQVPEFQYRLRQFCIYFTQLIAQHCCHSLPSGLRAEEGSPFQYQNQKFTFQKLHFWSVWVG